MSALFATILPQETLSVKAKFTLLRASEGVWISGETQGAGPLRPRNGATREAVTMGAEGFRQTSTAHTQPNL